MRQRPSAASSVDSRTPRSYMDDRRVSLPTDVKAFVFHVDVVPQHTPSQLSAVLAQAAKWGLEPLDPEDEDDAEILDDGTIRIWLAPTVPAQPWIAEAANRVDHALINHLEVMTS